MKIVVTMNEIEGLINKIKDEKKSVAFTNGCFDILHRGHVEYLEKAKEYADILVLGLNSDDSVKRIKKSPRPYVNENDRAFILSRLKSVDIVCIFNEDTPVNLIKKVKPDYLIKGGDYKTDEIVGKEIVEEYGGKVLSVNFVSGVSSSAIVKKIQSEKKSE
jgi:rfaE bifunctional protein nucleotidyltransferase chain/domain